MKCFKSRKPRVKPPTAAVVSRSKRTRNIFIVIGHNRSAQGATNYLGESEYVFNKRIAAKLQNYLGDRDVKVYTITRPTGRYGSQVRKVCNEIKDIMETQGVKRSLGMQLHFNDAGMSARGCECLVLKYASNAPLALADNVTDLLNERLGIKERHDDGVYQVGSSHNGAGMMIGLDDIGVDSTIVEACFAGYRTLESEAVFSNEDRYVAILGDGIIKTIDESGETH
jgi:N-acetylmuramoyl-L-alanine amidase